MHVPRASSAVQLTSRVISDASWFTGLDFAKCEWLQVRFQLFIALVVDVERSVELLMEFWKSFEIVLNLLKYSILITKK